MLESGGYPTSAGSAPADHRDNGRLQFLASGLRRKLPASGGLRQCLGSPDQGPQASGIDVATCGERRQRLSALVEKRSLVGALEGLQIRRAGQRRMPPGISRPWLITQFT